MTFWAVTLNSPVNQTQINRHHLQDGKMVCDTHGGILQGFWNLYGVQNRRSLKTKYVAFYESEGGYGCR